jgi:hypothetical protein
LGSWGYHQCTWRETIDVLRRHHEQAIAGKAHNFGLDHAFAGQLDAG